jgi:hypothetical protein
MADLIATLIRVLRADPVVIDLCAARVDYELKINDGGNTYPAIVVAQDTGPADDGAGALEHEVIFEVITAVRSDAVTLCARLRSLFGFQYGITIGSGADALLIIHCHQLSQQGLGKEDDGGPWIAREQYFFQTPTS